MICVSSSAVNRESIEVVVNSSVQAALIGSAGTSTRAKQCKNSNMLIPARLDINTEKPTHATVRRTGGMLMIEHPGVNATTLSYTSPLGNIKVLKLTKFSVKSIPAMQAPSLSDGEMFTRAESTVRMVKSGYRLHLGIEAEPMLVSNRTNKVLPACIQLRGDKRGLRLPQPSSNSSILKCIMPDSRTVFSICARVCEGVGVPSDASCNANTRISE